MQSASANEPQNPFVQCWSFDCDYRPSRICSRKTETISVCPVVIKRLNSPCIDAERDMNVDEAV